MDYDRQATTPIDDGESADGLSRSHLVVVYDSLQECPYLEDKVARMPLEYPRRRITPEDLDQLLAAGYRRTGTMLYRTRCPDCSACIPTRVEVDRFRFSRSMKRVLNRSDRELQISWGIPQVDTERLRIFNQHRLARDLSRRGAVDATDYHEFLVATCVETTELAFHLDGRLIGIAIADLGKQSVNAVYTHFDPEFSRYSIGTLAVLRQILFARETGRKYLYLGLFVAENSHLNYKERFVPQQRLLGGSWQDIHASVDGAD